MFPPLVFDVSFKGLSDLSLLLVSQYSLVMMVSDLQPHAHHRNVYCIGRNHPELPIIRNSHRSSSEPAIPQMSWPTLSSKSVSSLGSDTSIIPITSSNQQVDWEAELVVEIAENCFQLADFMAARECISRWGVGNDVTDRFWQKRGGGQWIRGKSFPGFAPFAFGVDARQAAAAFNLDLQVSCFVNDQLMQRGSLSDLIWQPDQLVWQISQSIGLLQGDLVFCGTFPGSALNRTPSVYLRAGDFVVTEIQGLGRLVNPVKEVVV